MGVEEALLRLQEADARFVSGDVGHGSKYYRARREQIAAGLEPFAIVVACSGSRVP